MKNLSFFCAFMASILMAACNASPKVNNPPEIKNKGVHIDYTDTHKGDTTLLFVHGWCINKTYFNDQTAYFKKNYRVITMDLAGYGKSGKNRSVWNAQTFATDVDAVINQLHLKNVVLIGHSMSGDIVMESTIHNPKEVIAIVGIDNFKNSGVPNRDSIKSKKEYVAAMYQLKHNFKSIAYPYVTKQLFYKTTPLSVRQKVLYDLAQSDTIIAAASLGQDPLDEIAELKKANKPLFIISSDVNKTDTSGLHNKGVPLRLFYIHAVGHYPMIEKPEEFNQSLKIALTQLNSFANHRSKR